MKLQELMQRVREIGLYYFDGCFASDESYIINYTNGFEPGHDLRVIFSVMKLGDDQYNVVLADGQNNDMDDRYGFDSAKDFVDYMDGLYETIEAFKLKRKMRL